MRCKPSGPIDAPFLVVGEAPGKEEEMLGTPFVGASGQELRRMLSQAGIDPAQCRYTNVFMDRPADNKLEAFCASKTSVGGKSYDLPALSQGQYVVPGKLFELARLRDEIIEQRPKLILAVGNTPCWALLRRTGITKLRGNVFPCELVDGAHVLPTYHPAAVLRDWSLRVIALQDFMKGLRYVTQGFAPPRRRLWLAPSLHELLSFVDREIFCNPRPQLLSFDIETFAQTITCIGFSGRPAEAITVPFYDARKPDRNYWASKRDELDAWRICKRVLESDIPKLGQNGLYDIQYLFRSGIAVQNYEQDTMIRHHALFPELPKGLGFLGSIYTDEAPWKLLRARGKETQNKLEDE